MGYGSVPGFFLRNPQTQVSSAAVSGYYLDDASAYLDAVLGDRFAVPFSSNNKTVNMLVYDLVEMKARAVRERDGDKLGAGLKEWVETMIDELRDGLMVMMQAASITPATGSADTIFWPPFTPLQASPALVPPWNQVYATRGGYSPVFDMDDWIYQQVDPNLVQQLRDDRGIGEGISSLSAL